MASSSTSYGRLSNNLAFSGFSVAIPEIYLPPDVGTSTLPPSQALEDDRYAQWWNSGQH